MGCLFPYLVENPLPSGFSLIPVPCGKCYDCRMRYAQQWCFRIMQEEKICNSSSFITLTYNTDSVPITRKGLMSLDPGDHIRTYFKRLRNRYRYRAINPKTGRTKYYYDKVPKIKYYIVGEYGSKKSRPHYHAVVFNADPEYLVACWPYGDVHIGHVSGKSVMYSLKYIMKEGKIPLWNGDDRIPEYRRSSQKIGINYLTPQMVKFHRERPDEPYITTQDKFKMAIPRYFKEKIWTKEELQKINPDLVAKMETLVKIEENKFNKSRKYKNKISYEDNKRKLSDVKRRMENSNQERKRDF